MELLLVIVGLILLLSIPFIKSATTKGFARGIAKAQLRTFRSLKKRNSHLSNRELYIEMISCRPGYSEIEAKNFIKRTEDFYNSPLMNIINKPVVKKEINLIEVVISLVYHEFLNKTGQSIGNERYSKMYDEVIKIIPKDL